MTQFIISTTEMYFNLSFSDTLQRFSETYRKLSWTCQRFDVTNINYSSVTFQLSVNVYTALSFYLLRMYLV